MKKNIIIMIILSLLIILTVLLVIIINNNRSKDVVLEQAKENIEHIQYEIKPANENVDVFTVQKYIQKYIEQINVNNPLYYTGDIKLEQSIISKYTYSLLSKEYIEKNSITEENVYEYVNKVEESLIFIPLKMNMISLENTTKYAIYGFTQTTDNVYKEDVYFIFNVDINNSTYSIEPVQNIKSIEEINLTKNNLSIEKNRYNSYKEEEITDEYICDKYLDMYKKLILGNTKKSYEYLNKEYRDRRFHTLQDYESYVDNNKDKIVQAILDAYLVEDNRYICQDQWENYYIFNINGVLDYNVILDTYTIDLPEFTEKYEKANEQEKVILNTNRVITALNAKDYRYIYSKLADSFKNNYFQTEEALKEFLVNNLYENNDIDFEEFSQEGTNLYTYKVRITKILSEEEKEKYYGKNAPSQYMNIVMQLNEGTDFVMSFSIEE